MTLICSLQQSVEDCYYFDSTDEEIAKGLSKLSEVLTTEKVDFELSSFAKYNNKNTEWFRKVEVKYLSHMKILVLSKHRT